MKETKEETIRRIFKFQPMVPMRDDECTTIEEFHEFCCAFAVERFKAKTMENDENVAFYVFRRPGFIHAVQSCHANDQEKRAVQFTIRSMLELDIATLMVASVMEVWIASENITEDFRKYPSVRETPGRDDGLMVSSEHRSGDKRLTKWVVKLKKNPANNRMLARDDVDLTDADLSGYQFGLFAPLRLPEREEKES